jgi:hypothetical protein
MEFMPAKIKTEGKYVHEDIKEQQSSQLNAPKSSETRHTADNTQAKTVSSASSSKPKNGNKGKLVESDNLIL